MATKRIFRGVKKVSDCIDRITLPYFMANGGNIIQKIHFNWPRFIGEKLAPATLPGRIDFPPDRRSKGTLYVKVFNPSLSLIISADESRIISKISTFFGYQVIARIKVVVDLELANQVSPLKEQAKRKIFLTEDEQTNLKNLTNSLEEGEFKTALDRFINESTTTSSPKMAL